MTIEEQTINEAEQLALEQLKSLDQEDGLLEPDNIDVSNDLDDGMKAMTAMFTAQMGLSALEGSLKLLVHPKFEFSESSKAEALEKFAPLLVKYGVMLPDLIMKYQLEIEGAKAAFVLIKEGYQTSKHLKETDPIEKDVNPTDWDAVEEQEQADELKKRQHDELAAA